MSRRNGPSEWPCCSTCNRAKGMLVSTEPMIMAGSDHCGWPLASSGRRGRLPVRASFRRPVAGGAERRQKKAAEEHLLKERRHGDAEGEHQPGGARGELIIFSMGALEGPGIRTWSRIARPKQPRATPASGQNLERHRAAPLQSGEEALVPDHRKDEECNSA
jgi:hypothetical protein